VELVELMDYWLGLELELRLRLRKAWGLGRFISKNTKVEMYKKIKHCGGISGIGWSGGSGVID